MAAAGTLTCLLASGLCTAQDTQEVRVQATRALQTKIAGRTDHLVPIREISLGYGVSLAGIDLSTRAGAAELEKRINEAALAACKEIGRQYPKATPDDPTCAKAASDEAMSKVHDLIAAARQRSAH